MDKHLCVNACHVCYYDLIQEEVKIAQKEINEIIEKLKKQVVKAKGNHDELVKNTMN